MSDLLDLVMLSEEASRIVREFRQMGYECILEYRPKEDWPKEDSKLQDERYVFAYGRECWKVLIAKSPDSAVKLAYESEMVF